MGASLDDDTPTTCSFLGEEGWDITADEASLSVSFGYDFGLIDSVLFFTSGIDETKKSQNPIMGGDDKMEIFRAKMSEATVEYPNKIYLEILKLLYHLQKNNLKLYYSLITKPKRLMT